MEGPTATTQTGRLNLEQFKLHTDYTAKKSAELAEITRDNPTLQNACKFVDALNRFANLYAEADDGVGANALGKAARQTVHYAENITKIFGGHIQEALLGVSDSGLDHLDFGTEAASHPQETLVNMANGLKELTIFTAKIMAIGEMSLDNSELALDAFNREIRPTVQPLYDRLEAMTGPERTRFITRTFCNLFLGKYLSIGLQAASLGISVPNIQQFRLATAAAKEFYGSLINEAEIVSRIPNFANLPQNMQTLLSPLISMTENPGKLVELGINKGQEFARRIAIALGQNPELVVTEGSFDGAVARLVGDFEKEGAAAAAADDLASFRKSERGASSGTAVQAEQSYAKMFEQRISKMPVGERVAAVTEEAQRIAAARGWEKMGQISRRNGERIVYKDKNASKLYSVDIY